MSRVFVLVIGFVSGMTVGWLLFDLARAPAQEPQESAASAGLAPEIERNEGRDRQLASYRPDNRSEKLTEQDQLQDIEAERASESSTLAVQSYAVRTQDFGKLLSAYDTVSARTLEKFNERYADAIAFRTEGEFQWMEEQGFPLPEEILAAAQMSLSELRSLAENGDQKAQFLYLDRALEKVRDLRDSYLRSGISPEGLREIPEYGDALIEAAYAKGFVSKSESPFAGYLMAEFSRAAFANQYGYMAGLLYASDRGDARAHTKLRSFVREQGICEETLPAMGMYAALLETSRSRPENP